MNYTGANGGSGAKTNPRRRPDVPADFGWKGALRVADKLYEELAAEFQPGGVRMILRALRRRLDREGKLKKAEDGG